MLRHRWQILAVLAVLSLGLLTAACGGGNPGSAAQPTAQPQAAVPLMIQSDMVQGSKNVPADLTASRSCVLSSQFPRNSQVVFRAKIYDPITGNPMDDAAMASVQIKLANGQSIDMKYGAHPKNPPNEYFWTGSFIVAKDAPTGKMDYSIVATSKDGRTGTFKPIVSATSDLTVIDQTYPDPVATPAPTKAP